MYSIGLKQKIIKSLIKKCSSTIIDFKYLGNKFILKDIEKVWYWVESLAQTISSVAKLVTFTLHTTSSLNQKSPARNLLGYLLLQKRFTKHICFLNDQYQSDTLWSAMCTECNYENLLLRSFLLLLPNILVCFSHIQNHGSILLDRKGKTHIILRGLVYSITRLQI